MGMLIDGRWTEGERLTQAGAFVRKPSVYGDDLTPAAVAAIGAVPGRFHLIASLSCPWSHRTILIRALKGLSGVLPLQIAGGVRVEGYPVNGGASWQVPGAEESIVHVHELYTLSDRAHSGRATVPILWDGATGRIVSNASERIMRALDAVPASGGACDFTLVPGTLRAEIDALNGALHERLADGVYRAGLAERQSAYDDAVAGVFGMLDKLERRLSGNRYLFGTVVTEADWHLFAGAGALRCGLQHAFQMHPAAACRPSEPVGLRARPLCVGGHRRDGRLHRHSRGLLSERRRP